MVDVEAIGPWKNNAEMIAAAAGLGYVVPPVLDLTWGNGGFWTEHKPESLTRNDLYSVDPDVMNFDARATGLTERLYQTVVFDPPYKLGGTPACGEMDERYGTEEAATLNERITLLAGGIAEGVRLTNKFLLVKVQDQVSGGQVRWLTDIATDVATALGMRKVDELVLTGGGRPQPPGRRQVHARHNHSTLLVFSR